MKAVEKQEVLYAFDGPLVFVAELDGRPRFFVAFDEKGGSRSFLAASTDPQTVCAIREGKLSVLGGLKAGKELHTVEITHDMQAGTLIPVTLDDIKGRLPKPNVGVSHLFGECPDELPKAEAACSRPTH